jgi:hypothetical protein
MKKVSMQPSIVRIIQSDYTAGLAVIAPLVTWGMYIATEYFGFFPGLGGHNPLTGEDAPFFLILAIITTLIFIPILIWRVRSFQTLFSRGIEVPGHITNIRFNRDRGRVEYTYTYQGQIYQTGNGIYKTKRTKALQQGDEIVLMVDQDNPKRALIRDIYL